VTEVENIKSGNKILNDKVSKLEQTVDDVVTKLNEIAEGEKGEPGTDCDVIKNTETPQIENKILNETLSKLEQTVDNIVTKLNNIYSTYTFKITPEDCSFDSCRKMCQQLGGDLIQASLGEGGSKYHTELRQIMESSGKHLWVGITDREDEGTFKFLNGEVVRLLESQPLLYNYKPYLPSGHARKFGNCIHYAPPVQRVRGEFRNAFKNDGCNVAGRSKVGYHGLCEIQNKPF